MFSATTRKNSVTDFSVTEPFFYLLNKFRNESACTGSVLHFVGAVNFEDFRAVFESKSYSLAE